MKSFLSIFYTFIERKNIRNVPTTLSLAAVFLLSPLSAYSELLFEDSFESGDTSKHNDYFRWGKEGDIKRPGNETDKIMELDGPEGSRVNAFEFKYGKWQELGFHLTESVDQVVTAYDNPETDSYYKEVWISYDLKVPTNYYHRDNRLVNNKFFALWQGTYSPEVKLQGVIEMWPTGDGLSRLSVNRHGHMPNFDSVSGEHQVIGDEEKALAFLPAYYGNWINIGLHWVAPSAHGAKNGRFEYYVNGMLKARMENIDYQLRNPQTSGPIGFNRGYVLGYHNSGYNDVTKFYVTNFKFGTSKKSVIPESSNAPSFARPPSNFLVEPSER